MNAPPEYPTPSSVNPFIFWFAGAVIAAVILYYIFFAINTAGLETRSARVTVQSKEYVEPSTSYAKQRIGDQMQTVMQAKGEMHLLHVEIDGSPATAVVEPQLYRSIREGDAVDVDYQRRRLTGAVQVVEVRLP